MHVYSLSLHYVQKNKKEKFCVTHVVCNKFMMPPKAKGHKHKVKFESAVVINGDSYKQQIILSGANVPTKLSIDRLTNNLFFCINADANSHQSFQIVVLNLDTGSKAIIPGIRNGFASAVDPTGSVYLGGSDGIYQFNYDTHKVFKLPIISGVDVFDMFFHNWLYFVETANQNLFMWKKGEKLIVEDMEGYGIHYFAITAYEDILFVNATGVYMMRKGTLYPITLGGASRGTHIRGVTTDVNGVPYLIAQDGIYAVDMTQRHVERILALENGYGIAFDKDNNIFYSDERSVVKLIRQINTAPKHKK